MSKALPERFALVFDGWTRQQTHYVWIFAVYASREQNGYSKFLFVFSQFKGKERLDASCHLRIFEFVQSVFKTYMYSVASIIRDNYNVKKYTTAFSFPLTGLHSHRFNLATQEIFEEVEYFIKLIMNIMIRMKHIIPAAKL